MRIERLVFFKNVIIVSVFYDFFTGSKKIDVEMYFDD